MGGANKFYLPYLLAHKYINSTCLMQMAPKNKSYSKKCGLSHEDFNVVYGIPSNIALLTDPWCYDHCSWRGESAILEDI
jgi:hypothetical protein